MRLLVTNDDGINSLFLHELIHALKAAGHELFVVAPVNEQSWTGASKTRSRPVKSGKVDRGFGCPTWIVDGTPSDCVNIALAHLLPAEVNPPAGSGAAGARPPAPAAKSHSDQFRAGAAATAARPSPPAVVDGVVSGINVGFNCSLGFIIASGTIAGAWEGALHGLPALAVSQDVTEKVYAHLKEQGGEPEGELLETLRLSAGHAARLVNELFPATPPNSFCVHNVNFPYPCRADTPVRRTVPAHVHVPGLFSPAADDGSHRLVWGNIHDLSPPEPLTDVKCLEQGAISHTVLDYRRLGHA